MAMETWLPFWEIAFGAGALVVSLMFHGVSMFWIQRRNPHFQRFPALHWKREAAFSVLIFLMLVTHLVEVLMWAAAIVYTDALKTFREAYYYAAVTYTTLGYGEGTLPAKWRILAPMMAMSGVFAFGWTTSVLFSIVGTPAAIAPSNSPADATSRSPHDAEPLR